jgi:hypothetical protein
LRNNSILNKAKCSENTDEWYTDYKNVAEEVSHYKGPRKGKLQRMLNYLQRKMHRIEVFLGIICFFAEARKINIINI